MPFTPFHFGPGMLVKGIAPRWWSWTSYAVTQVVIDVETLFNIVRNHYPAHGALHTFLGGSLAGAATATALVAARHGARRALPRFSSEVERQAPSIRAEAGTGPIFAGGVIGGALHALLDGFMHPDSEPFMPWMPENPLLHVVRFGPLIAGCVLSGLVGVALLSLWLSAEQRARRTVGAGADAQRER
jgi:hypothetical protein